MTRTIALFACLLSTGFAAEPGFYVAPNGADTNPGTIAVSSSAGLRE